MSNITWFAPDEASMMTLGLELSKAFSRHPSGMVYLSGTLGMGKTTLCRAIVQSLGWSGSVKSPTYNLVESYDLEHIEINHFDLYRIADAEEIEYLGIEDFLSDKSINLVEWPDKGDGYLPAPDLTIQIDQSESGRLITLIPRTLIGTTWCQYVEQ